MLLSVLGQKGGSGARATPEPQKSYRRMTYSSRLASGTASRRGAERAETAFTQRRRERGDSIHAEAQRARGQHSRRGAESAGTAFTQRLSRSTFVARPQQLGGVSRSVAEPGGCNSPVQRAAAGTNQNKENQRPTRKYVSHAAADSVQSLRAQRLCVMLSLRLRVVLPLRLRVTLPLRLRVMLPLRLRVTLPLRLRVMLPLRLRVVLPLRLRVMLPLRSRFTANAAPGPRRVWRGRSRRRGKPTGRRRRPGAGSGRVRADA